MTGTPLAPLVQDIFPAVRTAVRISPWEGVVRTPESCFREDRFFFADSMVFDIFTFPLIAGDPKRVLAGPNQIVLTEETAQKYFGDDNPVGKTLTFDNTMEFTVTGILRSLPSNSHLQFDFLASFETLERTYRGWTEHWDAPVSTYILLDDRTDPAELESQFPAFAKEYRGVVDGSSITYWLQPLAEIHLSWDTSDFTIYVFPAIAVFILLLAGVNYVNLSTARATRRAREVGIRKVVGAQHRQLVYQFLGDSVLISLVAMPVAIALAELFLPALNSLAGIRLTIDYFSNPYVLPGLFAITLLIGLLAGGYPALVLASFRPLKIFRGSCSMGRSGSRFRSGLVVFQFTIAITLIVASIVAHNQLTFLLTSDLGFDTEEVLVMRMDDPAIKRNYSSLKNELVKQPGILAVSAASDMPGGIDCRGLTYRAAEATESTHLPTAWVDHDYLKTLGIRLADGRDFSTQVAADAGSAFILNRSAVEYLGLGDGLGRRMKAYPDPAGQGAPWHEGPIVGITEDFHFRYLRCRLQPLVMIINPERCSIMLVRISPENIRSTMTVLQRTWENIVPGSPLEFTFLNEEINHLYRSEERFAAIIRYAGLLAVLVASLGLIGLAAYLAETRTKEIGIRKVLGASAANIILLLSKEFFLLILVANALAWPIGYYLMNKWLQDFVYRTEIGLETFILTGLTALLIVLITVSFQAVKAALANPVDSLRHE
jgi:putative ABC transport system permease protein